MLSLGICVPTYRRPALLSRCIDSIIEQMEPNLAVTIFISDDSESDINEPVVRAAMERFSDIVFQRNVKNLGINENIKVVTKMASTDYIWLIGEDDFFLPGCIAYVFQRMQEQDFQFIACNYAFVGDGEISGSRTAFSLESDSIVSGREFVRDDLWAAGFIGACVFSRAAWGAVEGNRYDGTYYAHVGHIVEMLAAAHASRILIIGRACVANRAEDASFRTWRQDTLAVYLGFETMCRSAMVAAPHLVPELDAAIREYRHRQQYLRFGALVKMRADGILDMAGYRKSIAPAVLPNRYKIEAWLLVLLPCSLLDWLLECRRRLLSRP